MEKNNTKSLNFRSIWSKIILRLGCIIPDKYFIQAEYYNFMGKKLNLKNPTSFNEKLQWLKLYDRNPDYTDFVNKEKVKEIVATRIGEQFIIPTLGSWDSFDEINFEELPEKFVLKCTHDSGGVIIFTKKSPQEIQKAKDKINRLLKHNFFYSFREWPYKYVPHRIIAEEYIEDPTKTGDLRDYKFFCFNGEPRFFKVDFNRQTNHRANYYDLNWNLLPFGEAAFPPDPTKAIEKPKNFELMVEFAKILSSNTKFLRVDLYNIEGQIYFGEMTFFPAGGHGKFTNDEWDILLGNYLDLTQNQTEIQLEK